MPPARVDTIEIIHDADAFFCLLLHVTPSHTGYARAVITILALLRLRETRVMFRRHHAELILTIRHRRRCQPLLMLTLACATLLAAEIYR